MSRVILIIVFLVLSGCSNLRIIEADIIHLNENELGLAVRTNKDLSKYIDTSCVVRPYIHYMVSPSETEHTLSSKADIKDMPYSLFEPEYVNCPNRVQGFCSVWPFESSETIHINNIRYSYELNKESEINVKVGGGSMLSIFFYYFGCGLSSNEYKLGV